MTCSVCNKTKAIENFAKNKAYPLGVESRCKECKNLYNRLWRSRPKNKEKIARYNKSYNNRNGKARVYRDLSKLTEQETLALRQQDNRIYLRAKRARRRHNLQLPYSNVQIEHKVQYWGEKCWLCKNPWKEIDHVKPLRVNGPDILANLRPICIQCNRRKRDKWPLTQEIVDKILKK